MRSVSGVTTRRIELPRYSLPYWKHASTCLTRVMPSGDEPGEQPLAFCSCTAGASCGTARSGAARSTAKSVMSLTPAVAHDRR